MCSSLNCCTYTSFGRFSLMLVVFCFVVITRYRHMCCYLKSSCARIERLHDCLSSMRYYLLQRTRRTKMVLSYHLIVCFYDSQISIILYISKRAYYLAARLIFVSSVFIFLIHTRYSLSLFIARTRARARLSHGCFLHTCAVSLFLSFFLTYHTHTHTHTPDTVCFLYSPRQTPPPPPFYLRLIKKKNEEKRKMCLSSSARYQWPANERLPRFQCPLAR